jgi:hypothetical protein
VRSLSTVTIIAACASILSACSGPTQQSASDGFKKNIASIFDPQLAARQNYDRALAEYQNCYAANPANRDACDQQRQMMEAAVKLLSATQDTGR